MNAIADRERSHARLKASAIARLITGLVMAATALMISGCSQSSQTYDISPIFPLSSDKCSKYNGHAEGEGFNAHCWVTLADCKKAAADWQEAMKGGGVEDAIVFSCD